MDGGVVVVTQLVAGLLGVEAGQDAVIRTLLYTQKDELVPPYNYTVAQFTDNISSLRNNLSHAFVDEGLEVPISEGSDGLVTGNVLSANNYSISYARTAQQVLETVYGTGNASLPGGFYPQGGNGTIALGYLKSWRTFLPTYVPTYPNFTTTYDFHYNLPFDLNTSANLCLPLSLDGVIWWVFLEEKISLNPKL